MIALDVARNHCSQGGDLPTLDRLQYPASITVHPRIPADVRAPANK